MRYQQTVYYWLLRQSSPAFLREIVRGTGLARDCVAHTLTRLRRYGYVVATKPRCRDCQWLVTDDRREFIGDGTGRHPNSLQNLLHGGPGRRRIEKAVQHIHSALKIGQNTRGTVRPQET